MSYSTLTSKGQMTLPKEVRDRFNLKAGDKLSVTVEDDRIVLAPVTLDFNDLTKILPRPEKTLSIEEIDRAIRRRAAARSK
ncbi:AbrB/MazE/SpoVT family DNA-binding domain-containing protein [bacterium]|nr:MAG: AbrB/MazE/SpoVT family DNA-binding domain-containing protein [bacterium]